MGIAVTTITLVAACVVSVVFRPDREMLRPIDNEASRLSGDAQSKEDCPSCGDGTEQSGDPTSNQ